MTDVPKIWNYIYDRWGGEPEAIEAAVATMYEVVSASSCVEEAGETVSTLLVLLRDGFGIYDTEELCDILLTAGLSKDQIQQVLD